jgi:sigma-B regulation protein RsbU (phosphoserine phosphatase)
MSIKTLGHHPGLSSDSYSQRQTYKIIEKFTSGEYKSEVHFLTSMIKELVDNRSFEIVGGRVWEFCADDMAYTLQYQYGNVQEIPHNYSLPVDEYPILKDLINNKTQLHKETDSFLQTKGITVYSVTGVGNIINTPNGKFFKYVLGFNAPEILQSFFETLSIISSIATMTLRDLSAQLEQAKIKKDIDRASEIQRGILPEHYLEFNDFKIFGVCVPDSAVGGDYFDYIKSKDTEEESVGILIGDAVSKGLPAAIQALFVTGAVRMAMNFVPKLSHMFNRLNNLVCETFPYDDFVTLFYCELNMTHNRMVVYANAGHNAPIHYRPSTDSYQMLGPTGGLLGIIKDSKYKIENCRMLPGDILVLYTDGITEAHSSEGDLYGEERLMQKVREFGDLSSKEIALKILEDVQTFSTNTVYNDDKTLVVIKRDPK